MEVTFYVASALAILATIMVVTSYNIIHALLYLVISFLAISVVFFILGAPFMAALEVIVYAGAIVVLIIFVIMMLNLKRESAEEERQWLTKEVWIGPAIMGLILMMELIYIVSSEGAGEVTQGIVDSKAVGLSLFGPYVMGVELSGILLMAGIVGAYHLGRQKKKIIHRFLEMEKE